MLRTAKNCFSTSPSVYIIYPNVFATNLCGTVGTEVDITWPYQPEEILTQPTVCAGPLMDSPLKARHAVGFYYTFCDSAFSTFNFADLNNCSETGNPNPQNSDRCQPPITFDSIGFSPQTIQHDWATCIFDVWNWYYDAPLALTPTAALDAPTMTLPTPSQTVSATAGAVLPAFPTKTAPPEHLPISTSTPASTNLGDPPTKSLSSVYDPSS